MDRVEREIRPVPSNHRPRAPSPWIEGYERDEDFAIHRTRSNWEIVALPCRTETYSVASFGDLLYVVFLRALTQRCLSVHFALDAIDVRFDGSHGLGERILRHCFHLVAKMKTDLFRLLQRFL